MKIFARIATAVTAALVSLFVAAPAFANDGVERVDQAAQFSSAGQPVDVVATLIVGAVLLAVVLITAQLLGGLFEKSGK